MNDPASRSVPRKVQVGLILAPVLFVLVWVIELPVSMRLTLGLEAEGLSSESHHLLAVFVAVIVLWVTEALPIAATALLIAPLLVLTGVTDAKTAFAPYASPLLFLFVGGFMIAGSMTRHGLDRRLAVSLVTAPGIGGVPWKVRAVFMATGVVLSMWISNTATTAILLPILIGMIGKRGDEKEETATTGNLLCVAYACSIGGLGTPVGSPPNLIAMKFLQEDGIDFAFFDWVLIGLPAAIIMVLFTFAFFQKSFPPIDFSVGADTKKHFGPLSRGELVTGIAFGIAVVGHHPPH
ncbi:MAG: SLC13 family permease, partial [Myxococcota bacterium]